MMVLQILALGGPTGNMSTPGLRNCENGDCIVGSRARYKVYTGGTDPLRQSHVLAHTRAARGAGIARQAEARRPKGNSGARRVRRTSASRVRRTSGIARQTEARRPKEAGGASRARGAREDGEPRSDGPHPAHRGAAAFWAFTSGHWKR